jgi:LL-diaminopimelate aminotransferase
MNPSDRLSRIPPYMFKEINRKIDVAKKAGVDVISLGVGDPDLPTPAPIVEALAQAGRDPANHQYPDYEGMPAFREAVAAWYKRRHGVTLDSDREVLTLIGAKEGSLHLSLSVLNPGDSALVPEPAYTPYKTSTILAEGVPVPMVLAAERGFLPDLSTISPDVAKKAKIIYVNYPNNPTAAVAGKEFYKELIDFAKDNDVLVCSDNPYSEIGYDGYRPLSFLEVDGAKDVGIELNSLSKPYNMTGWRIGMAVGNEEVVQAMGRVKSNVDSGVFNAVQHAGIVALGLPDSVIEQNLSVYQKRRDVMCDALEQIGLTVVRPKAAFYIWVKVPSGHTSASFATEVLEKSGVVITPGAAYGLAGEGYVRMSLTLPDARLSEAVKRFKNGVKI